VIQLSASLDRQLRRAYGRRGFTQYQFVIPFENGLAVMRKILTAILSSGELPFLNVLKRLGKESGGVLSFPREGYTFAILRFRVRRCGTHVRDCSTAMALSNYIDANYFSRRRDEMRVTNEERNHSDLESTIALLGSITVTVLTLPLQIRILPPILSRTVITRQFRTCSALATDDEGLSVILAVPDSL
jgi:hypothetical protein